LSDQITKAVTSYRFDVESGKFPSKENWFSMDRAELEKLRSEIGN
jgi:3-methyl-2-oxobutanoate hydroxymethyltransferase